MSRYLKNRGFEQPISLAGVCPQDWMRNLVNTNWNGAAWGGGAGRWLGGGVMPSRGQRCILIGAADATTSTGASGAFDSSDEAKYAQVVAAAVFANIAGVAIDLVVMDQGYDPGNWNAELRVVQGGTAPYDSKALNAVTRYALSTLYADLSTISASGINPSVTFGVERAAAGSAGAREIPRVYFENLRFLWTPYSTTPPRILRYSGDLVGLAATTITGTTVAIGSALANVANRRMSHPAFWPAGTSAYLLFNFGAAKYFNTVAVLAHNCVSGDTLTFSAGTTSACSDFSCVIPVNGSEASRNSFAEFIRKSYQYAKISWAGASRALQIGEICIGETMHMQSGYSWGARKGTGYLSRVLSTPYGSRWGYELGALRTFDMDFGKMDLADFYDWKYILDDAKGVYPILIIPEPNRYDCYYGYVPTQVSEIQDAINVARPGSVTLVEQSTAVVQT